MQAGACRPPTYWHGQGRGYQSQAGRWGKSGPAVQILAEVGLLAEAYRLMDASEALKVLIRP